jgi:plastocyanin
MPRVMSPAALSARTIAVAGAGLAMLAGATGCGGFSRGDDLIAGKRAFVAKCGSCHTLSRAGTTGVTGPNLDEAFDRAIQDGIKRSTIKGVVHRQIEQPNRRPELNALDLKDRNPGPLMPANIVKGGVASDVAAYVAFASAKPGKDAGRLGEVGARKATATTSAKNGTLDIPVDPSGALAYAFASATAPAGALTVDSKNPTGTPHDIAIEGNGVNEHGPVVQNGGTSTFKVTLKPGSYTFYCTVPGHREGGMVGKLTVK